MEMTQLYQQIPGIIGFKDTNSVYLGGNAQLASLMGVQHANDIAGLTDHDVQSEIAELAEIFIIQDQTVLNKQTIEQHIDIGRHANGDLRVHFSSKKSLLDENQQVLGTVYNCIELHSSLLTHYYDLLLHEKGPVFYQIGGQYQQYELSSRASHCLFYLLRGYTAKGIGKQLRMPSKTVEYYIEQLKSKFDAYSKADLIDKAISLGFFFNLPVDLLAKLHPHTA